MVIKCNCYHIADAAVEGQLQVLPNGTVFNLALGSNAVFTCQVVNMDPVGVIINIQWYDRTNHEILDLTSGRDKYVKTFRFGA